MQEEWRPVKGYEGYYEVSNRGAVRSLTRSITRKDGVIQTKEARLMTPIKSQDGYLKVKLSKEGVTKTVAIHRLVAEAYVRYPGDDDDGCVYEVNHIDCDRKNNSCENLEWVTHAYNVKYAIQQRHHVCTRDLTGRNNPNYDNHILTDFYREHPELRKKLGRPGNQNGRAKPIAIYDKDMNQLASFSWIGGCAQYLSDAGISGSNPKYLRDRIAKAASTNKLYLGHFFKFI